MSYQFTVVVEDGKATVDESGTTLTNVADGRYVVNGHTPTEGTWQAEHIEVSRYANAKGSVTIRAASTHHIDPPEEPQE
jgi:hypothetical protein